MHERSRRCAGSFFSSFRPTHIGHRMFRLTEASISCRILSAVVTYEHRNSDSSPTHLQSIGGGGKLREPDKCSPDTTGPVVPKGPGAGAASLEAGLPGTSMLVPRFTKSRSKPPVACDEPSAPGITRTGASHASDLGSSNAGDSTMARSPMLTANDATKGGRRDVTGGTTNRRTTGADEVQLLPPQHHLSKSGQKLEKWE
jgi:hypothetical protein